MTESRENETATERPWSQQLEGIIKRRKLSVIMIIAGFLVLLVLFNVANFIFYNRIRDQLESEQELRLKSVAVLCAGIVEGFLQPAGLQNEITLLLLEDRLSEIKRMHQLEGLYIIDRNYGTIADSYAGLDINVSHSYLKEDSSGVVRAWSGLPMASPLYVLNGQRFKSAYAPVHDLGTGEVQALLVTEANAQFFDVLERYRNTFLIIATGSGFVFILFSSFIVLALRLLIKTQESLSRSERLAMMGQMSAVLAHEIRNPLGIIRGTADVLKTRYTKAGKNDPMFEYIPDEVDRLNKLVNNFLLLSKKTQLSFEKNDLNELIRDTIEKSRLGLKENKVIFHFGENDIKPFLFDRDAVEQVLINLVRNAIQSFDKKGEVTISAREIKRKKKTYAQIQVQDTGTGIKGDQGKVFEPFYTTKSSGSGLGMPVSKKIIEGHGGEIAVESAPGNGTTVTVVIPYMPVETEA